MPASLSRREFLSLAGAALSTPPKPVFEEVPPESSRIFWKHDNAVPGTCRKQWVPAARSSTTTTTAGWTSTMTACWISFWPMVIRTTWCSSGRPRFDIKEPLLLLRQEAGRFRNISASAGPVFSKDLAARGLSAGDFNNDGRVGLLIAINGDAPLLLKNNAGAGNHWVGLKLQGVRCNRDAIGARITWSAGGVCRSRFRRGGGSYLSFHDPREVVGLGRSH